MAEQVEASAAHLTDPVSKLLGIRRFTAIVDIGANPIDGDPPYKTMLQKASAA